MKLKGLKKAILLGTAVGVGTYAYKKYEELKVFYNQVIVGDAKTLYYSSEFEDDSVAAIASGVKLNFLGVHPESPSVYLNIYSMGSSVNILVPDECRVILDGNNTVSNITVEGDYNDEIEKEFTLYIDYKVTASSVRIIYESALKNEVEEGKCGCCCDSEVECCVEEVTE